MSATRLLAMTLTSAIALTSSVPLVHAQETPTAAPVKKKVAKKPKSAAPIDPYADAPADAAPSATTLDPYANAAEPATRVTAPRIHTPRRPRRLMWFRRPQRRLHPMSRA